MGTEKQPYWVQTLVVAAGLLLCLLVTWSRGEELGSERWFVFSGAALVVVGVMWIRWQATRTGAAETLLKETQQELEAELTARSADLDRREQALADRFVTYHQWQEFPPPIDLVVEPEAERLSELARCDRQMFQLLEEESERLFEAVRQNKYAPDKDFDVRLLRDDLDDLVRRVAQIYQPELKHPLLETSMAKVLPAASRACLQFLVALDQLPVNVTDRSIGDIYGYIRQAVVAYGVYKMARPYFPYVNSAYYLTRFAMGANPMTMGAWWVLSQVGKRGAESMANRIIHQQALVLMNNLLRIVGYEVAGIYGGDFRHRDPNWIYAAEVTDVVSHFPLTQELLFQSLQEIGAIQLRSEYDRVFLYRCLAAHRSAEPQRYTARNVLTNKERLAIAARLDGFIGSFLGAAPAKKMTRWKQQLENRLGVKLKDATRPSELEVSAQKASAVRSLASFLLLVKQCDFEELPALLQQSKIYVDSDDQQQQLWQSAWREDPPAFFERPDLSIGGPVVKPYIEDLITLETRTLNRGAQNDELIVDMAVHLREEPEATTLQLGKAYGDYLQERCASGLAIKQLPVQGVRAILDVLDDDEQLEYLYRRVRLVNPEEDPHEHRWLIGTERRCLLLTTDPLPRLLWIWEGDIEIRRIRGLVRSDCRIEGGRWLDGTLDGPPVIRIAGQKMSRYHDFFRPLLQRDPQDQ